MRGLLRYTRLALGICATIAVFAAAVTACVPDILPWRPTAGHIGVSVLCSTPSTWTFSVGGADLGTWAAEPPESIAEFPVEDTAVGYTFVTWEREPNNIMTIVLDVHAGTVVKAQCGGST